MLYVILRRDSFPVCKCFWQTIIWNPPKPRSLLAYEHEELNKIYPMYTVLGSAYPSLRFMDGIRVAVMLVYGTYQYTGYLYTTWLRVVLDWVVASFLIGLSAQAR